MKDTDQKQDSKKILSYQQTLKQLKEKISHLKDKNIFIISGDYSTRAEIKGHFQTLGFPPVNIMASNSPLKVISQMRQDVNSVNLIICHQKVLDVRTSSQTGLQLIAIVKNILLEAGGSAVIPFVFVEKSFDKNEIFSGLKAGGSHFLVIPANPISLGNKLVDVFKEPENVSVSQEVVALLYQANKKRDMGHFDKAISIYNKALKITGENVEILNEKANALLELGDIDQAILLFKRVLTLKTNYPRAYQGLGMAYEQLGNINEARENYQKVLKFEPDNALIFCSIGDLYQMEKDYEKAKDYFEKGISLNKNFMKNYLSLAKNHEAQEKLKEALEVYKQALIINPRQTYVLITAGDFCLKHSMFNQAEELFSSAIGMEENQIHIYNRLGIALRMQKKYDKAIKNYASAIKIKPEDANLYYNQAKAYFLNGESPVAIDILNKAFNLDPDLKTAFKKDKAFSTLLEKFPDKFKF